MVLNAGCGSQDVPAERFPADTYQQVRLDADRDCEPDIVADLRAIPLEDGCADAVYTSHTLEHLSERGVHLALAEFERILRPGGELVVRVPDLAVAARAVLDDKLTWTLYESPAGPVRALDMLYGYQPFVASKPLYEHKMGFTARTLAAMLGQHRFVGEVRTNPGAFELIADVRKSPTEGTNDSHP